MNKQIHNIHQKINVTNIIQDGKPLTPPSTPPKPNKPAPAQNKHMSSFMQQLGQDKQNIQYVNKMENFSQK